MRDTGPAVVADQLEPPEAELASSYRGACGRAVVVMAVRPGP